MSSRGDEARRRQVTEFFPFEWPRWALMWTLAISIYIGCKWLTWRRTPVRHVPAWKLAAYLLAWPGLDAASFLEGGPVSNRARCRPFEWLAATGKLTFGVALLFGLARTIPPQHAYVVGWCASPRCTRLIVPI